MDRQAPSRSLVYLLAAGQLMVVIDGTVVNLALPSIAGQLGMTAQVSSWIVTSYVLAVAGTLLTFGRLSDRVGHRSMFVGGIGVFTLASLWCAVAPGFLALVAGRVAQGLGAAMISPAALALMTFSFSGDARIRALTIYNIVSSVGAGAGLLLGGLLTHFFSWRLIFAVNIPIGVALAFLVMRNAPAVRIESPKFGVGSSLLSVLAVSLGVAALLQLGRPHTAAPSGMLALATLLAIMWLTALERWGGRRLVPRAALNDRTFVLALWVRALASGAMFGSLFFLSYLMRIALEFDTLESAVGLLPVPVVSTLAAVWSRARLRVDSRECIIVIGTALLTFGTTWLAFASREPSLRHAYLAFMPGIGLLAAGVGCSFPALGAVALERADGHAGVRSALFGLAQHIGNPVGLAVMVSSSAVFQAYRPCIAQSACSGVHFAIAFKVASAFAVASLLCAWRLRSIGQTRAR